MIGKLDKRAIDHPPALHVCQRAIDHPKGLLQRSRTWPPSSPITMGQNLTVFHSSSTTMFNLSPKQSTYAFFPIIVLPTRLKKLTQWCLYPVLVGTSLRMHRSYFLFHSGIFLSRTLKIEIWNIGNESVFSCFRLLFQQLVFRLIAFYGLLVYHRVHFLLLFFYLTCSPYACIVNDLQT